MHELVELLVVECAEQLPLVAAVGPLVVDGAAEVEVRGGGDAVLRNLSGNPPQWRRFECTSIMPANPAGFRFEGVDGRGKQELVRDPRNGGAAVVRIEDPNGGSEGYTFRVLWGGDSRFTQDRGPGPGGRDEREFVAVTV